MYNYTSAFQALLIMRVLRKLWEPVTRRAQLCCDGSHHYVMFLPQKTYYLRRHTSPPGSLASQVQLTLIYNTRLLD